MSQRRFAAPLAAFVFAPLVFAAPLFLLFVFAALFVWVGFVRLGGDAADAKPS